MRKKKRKPHKSLNEVEKKAFAQAIIDGKMIKQLIAEYDISYVYGCNIINEFLQWKLEWKIKND